MSKLIKLLGSFLGNYFKFFLRLPVFAAIAPWFVIVVIAAMITLLPLLLLGWLVPVMAFMKVTTFLIRTFDLIPHGVRYNFSTIMAEVIILSLPLWYACYQTWGEYEKCIRPLIRFLENSKLLAKANRKLVEFYDAEPEYEMEESL